MLTRYMWITLLALTPGRVVLAQVTQPAASGAEIPVRSIVLFSSGVGYFEHAGTVRGNSDTELRFKTNQINDILKSLVLQDQDGGRVTSITYPSQDPISRSLRGLQVDIAANPSLSELLNQLRGTQVTLQTQAERVSGTILGVEFRRRPAERGEPVETPVLNLWSGAMLRSVELPLISSIALDDPRLQAELTQALALLGEARDQDKKPVTISFVGSGERRVRLGYVIESPVWKASYRLIMGDQGGRLQGWAIVENQTENDWNNVALSLVSGRPISFVMDLYQPVYTMRPVVTHALYQGLGPQLHDVGMSADRDRVSMSADSGRRASEGAQSQQAQRSGYGWITGVVRDASTGAPVANASVSIVGAALGTSTASDGRYSIMNVPAGEHTLRAARVGYSTESRGGVRVAANAQSTADLSISGQALLLSAVVTTGRADPATGMKAPFSVAYADMASTVQAAAAGAQLGELFQYTISNVTLERQKSAMLPIVADSVGIERVSIYNESVLGKNPLNGVRLQNTTSNHLLSGPVTVLDRGGYAGDAQIDNIPPGQARLVSFGIDLEMTVDNSKNTQTSAVTTGRIVKGMLHIERKVISSREYLADNKSQRDKLLVVEHPVRSGWKLLEPLKPHETTHSLYRFQGSAAAGKITSLIVKEEQVRSEAIAMIAADVTQLLSYSRTGEVPREVREAIARAVELRQAILDTERSIAARTSRISEITSEQTRIRENMKTVGQTTQYYQRLLAKLNEQESALEELQLQREDLETTLSTRRRALEEYLSALSIG